VEGNLLFGKVPYRKDHNNMVYMILLAVGGLGLVVQTVLGFAHGDGGDGHGHHAENHGHDAGHGHDHNHEAHSVWALLSPLRLFSLALGTGAAGVALGGLIRSPWLLGLVAVLLGVAFYQLVVRPLWRVAQQFASKPAENLQSVLSHEAIADSRFDDAGRGIVTVTVDGQIVRLLAQLDAPGEVLPGEKLVVTRIDGARNTCQVTKL
jgi:hypothetical protein